MKNRLQRYLAKNAPGGVTGRGVLVFNQLMLKHRGLVAALSAEELAVEACDVAELDVLRALGSAGTCVGAVTEAELVHLGNHSLHAAFCLNLTLWKQGKLADLSRNEEHSRTVLASCNASAATDASGRVHSLVGSSFGDRKGISVLCSAAVERNVTACLLNLVESVTIDHKVLDYRECS